VGEGTGRVELSSHDRQRDTGAPGPRETAQELGGEIAAVRSELDVLVAELDRRRHEALDLGLQVRRHAPGIAVTAVAFLGAAAGSSGSAYGAPGGVSAWALEPAGFAWRCHG
jgi:hypothetical protein